MIISEREYIENLYNNYDDPTQWDGENPKCKEDYCENEIGFMDDLCEECRFKRENVDEYIKRT